MRSPSAAADIRPTPRTPGFVWAGLLAAAILLVVFRLHAFNLPLETDECNYAYIGQRVLAGDRLYVDVWDHQPPGVYVLFAGAIAAFGNSPTTFRIMALVFALASLALLARLAHRYAGAWAAVAAGVLYALVSADPGTAGEGCNREIYMNTLLLAAWWLGAAAPRSRGRLLGAGMALGLASALKTVVAVHWLLLAGWIVAAEWRERRAALPALRALLFFSIGPAVLWAAIFAYFGATHRWAEFVDATFLFNVSYAEGDASFLARFAAFFHPRHHPFTFSSAQPLWIFGAAAVVGHAVLVAVDRHRDRAIPLLLFALASFIAVCLPAHFWPHYYHLTIPPLVLLVACALVDLSEPPGRSFRRGAVMVAVAFALALLASEWRWYLSQPPFGVTVARYASRDFWGRAIGEKVGQVTEPDDYVFVYGSDAAIYYYAQRRCASRYTMITGIAEGRAGAEARRRLMMDDLHAHPPRVIILLLEEPPFPAWRAFLDANYGQPVGWDLHDRTGEPIMFVLADPQRPIRTLDWNWDRAEVGGWNPAPDAPLRPLSLRK